jgi:hypothetical protein
VTARDGTRSGPDTDQRGSAAAEFTHSQRSDAPVSLYHPKTKNLLVSYSAQKLGFF